MVMMCGSGRNNDFRGVDIDNLVRGCRLHFSYSFELCFTKPSPGRMVPSGQALTSITGL